jgi:transposase
MPVVKHRRSNYTHRQAAVWVSRRPLANLTLDRYHTVLHRARSVDQERRRARRRGVGRKFLFSGRKAGPGLNQHVRSFC